MMMNVYLTGALFNEAEIAQRLKEGKLLKERFPQLLYLIQLNNHLMNIKITYLHHKKSFMQIQRL